LCLVRAGRIFLECRSRAPGLKFLLYLLSLRNLTIYGAIRTENTNIN
jgi:hypothetical protein